MHRKFNLKPGDCLTVNLAHGKVFISAGKIEKYGPGVDPYLGATDVGLITPHDEYAVGAFISAKLWRELNFSFENIKEWKKGKRARIRKDARKKEKMQ